MGKKTKIGKQRKDKFYKLAKETGYRSRASFKLIQLNRKFEFLQKSRILIDLCAAPGGWLQVAQQSMPVSSLIIGVDLVSIKPLPNVITLQEDITTEKCRQSLKKQLKTWKADIILHDGAPNVGKSWVHDAFAQIQLTLSALKLATEMLMSGGWFVTKVFRSKDYNNLLWVFQKLFKKVHVTKPQASRNESAEIFVVCQGYLAPDRIDPRFLDSSTLFKDVEDKSASKKNLLHITNKKTKAEGYEDGDASVFFKLKASDFILGDNPLELLAKSHQIIFDDDDIRDHRTTTDDIKENCKDIKVLGKGELRALLNWRKNLQTAIKEQEKQEKAKVPSETVEKDIEEVEIDDALKEAESLELAKYQELKRKKKKMLKERRKTNERINLKMIIKDDEPIIQEDRELFSIGMLKSKSDLSKVETSTDMEITCEPENDKDEEELLTNRYKSTYTTYDRHDDDHEVWEEEANNPAKKQEIDSSDDEDNDDEEIEFSTLQNNESSDNESALSENEDDNPLLVDLVEKDVRIEDTVNKWFDKEDFANVFQDDDDLELELLAENVEKQKKQVSFEKDIDFPQKSPMILLHKTATNATSKVVTNATSKVVTNGTSKAAKNNDKDDDKNECTDKENNIDKEDSVENKPTKKKKKRVMLDPEGLALGSLMIRSKKMKRDILDNAYNRYANNDDNLPDWFVNDEEKHNRKQLPVTAEMVAEYKQQLREINARSIKKVVEAKARKKKKALKRMEKARKKAEAVTENLDMGEKEKSEQLKTIYKKALGKKDDKVTYVVAKKGTGKRARRPTGVKGRFKVVDPRMKKDDRVRKIELKSQRKGRKAKPNKRRNRR